MRKNRKILRWGIFLLLCLLAATVPAALVYRSHTLPLSQCSELYRSYLGNPHIRAAFIKNFPINDTLSVDALLLQATDSVGWETLKKDFHAFPLPENNQKKIDQGIDVISIHLAPKTDPTLPMDTTDLLNNNVVAISRLHQTVSIFNVTTRAEMDAVRVNQFEIGL